MPGARRADACGAAHRPAAPGSSVSVEQPAQALGAGELRLLREHARLPHDHAPLAPSGSAASNSCSPSCTKMLSSSAALRLGAELSRRRSRHRRRESRAASGPASRSFSTRVTSATARLGDLAAAPRRRPCAPRRRRASAPAAAARCRRAPARAAQDRLASRRGPSATPSSCVSTPSVCAARRRMVSIVELLPRDVLAQPLALRRRRSARRAVEQRVDVDAVRLVGGDAAGRGVRVEEEPLLLEVAHRVADRRGRHAEPEPARQHARPGRLRGLDVRLDHRLEHAALARRELVDDAISANVLTTSEMRQGGGERVEPQPARGRCSGGGRRRPTVAQPARRPRPTTRRASVRSRQAPVRRRRSPRYTASAIRFSAVSASLPSIGSRPRRSARRATRRRRGVFQRRRRRRSRARPGPTPDVRRAAPVGGVVARLPSRPRVVRDLVVLEARRRRAAVVRVRGSRARSPPRAARRAAPRATHRPSGVPGSIVSPYSETCSGSSASARSTSRSKLRSSASGSAKIRSSERFVDARVAGDVARRARSRRRRACGAST